MFPKGLPFLTAFTLKVPNLYNSTFEMKWARFVSTVALVGALFEQDSTSVSAAPSHNSNLNPRRRHHSKVRTVQQARKIDQTAHLKRKDMDSALVNVKRDECDYGSWRCSGNDLQRCYDGTYKTLRTCASDTVCSTDTGNTGCVWSWQVDSASSSSTTESSFASVPTSASESATSSQASIVVASTTVTVNPWYTTSSTAAPSTTASTAWESSASESTWTSTGSETASTSSSTTSRRRHKTKTSSSAAQITGTTTETQSASSDPQITDSATTSVNITSLLPTATESAAGSTSTSTGSLAAPHYVVYSDSWLVDMPHTSAVEGYNRFILAFWLSDTGAADNAALWESLTQDQQTTVLQAYKAAGIELMVSAFGSTDQPITAGKDPVALAQKLAAWVKKNNLAGVDIDLEDNDAMNNGYFIDWIVSFQTELRNQLPSPYLISHAPQAPWFTSASSYNGGYVKIHEQVGSGIDFYNVQYYNQGNVYDTCESLLFDSGDDFPDSSVFQSHTVGGIPLDKLVIGKPINAEAASNGYMSADLLQTCVAQAKAEGWNAGVMYWEFDSTAVTQILTVVK